MVKMNYRLLEQMSADQLKRVIDRASRELNSRRENKRLLNLEARLVKLTFKQFFCRHTFYGKLISSPDGRPTFPSLAAEYTCESMHYDKFRGGYFFDPSLDVYYAKTKTGFLWKFNNTRRKWEKV